MPGNNKIKIPNHNDYFLLYKIGRAASYKHVQIFRVPEVIHITCNMGTHDLPGI